MLKRIEHQKIGLFNSTSILLNQFIRLNKKRIKKNDLEIFCKEIDRSFGETFNTILIFLTTLRIISKNNNNVTLNINKNLIIDTEKLKNHINNSFFSYLENQKIFFSIFPQSSISYNIQSASIYIKPNYFPLKYNYVKSYFISTGLFVNNFESKIIEVEKSYYKNFEKLLLGFKSSKKKHSKQSLDQLKNKLLKQEDRGYEAEKFVLKFERNRLKGHSKLNKVKIISQIDVNAGYDIVSYNSLDSTKIDRFIEVKSYSKSHGFFWTINEIRASKEKESSYFIYIINSGKINFQDYTPEIHNNPYYTIFNSDKWKKQNKVFYVTKDV